MSYRKKKKVLKQTGQLDQYNDSLIIYDPLKKRKFLVFFVIKPKMVHGKRGYVWQLTNTNGFRPGMVGISKPLPTIADTLFDCIKTTAWDNINDMPNFPARKREYHEEIKCYALTITKNYERIKADSDK